MSRNGLIIAILTVQVACTVFFMFDVLDAMLGLTSRPIAWELRELMEIGAALGLLLGTGLGAVALKRSVAARRQAEERLHRASGAFHDLLEERFNEWGLTPAERDVALLAIKGLTLSEIAGMRNTTDGTVKAQTNAIYRKAGVSGRPQLLSLFIEDLMADGAARVAAPAVRSVSAAE